MLKIGKYKNLFDNCCVVVAIGLIVFLTIDLYMFNTIEGNTSRTDQDNCPHCWHQVRGITHWKTANPSHRDKSTWVEKRCAKRWWGYCYKWIDGYYKTDKVKNDDVPVYGQVWEENIGSHATLQECCDDYNCTPAGLRNCMALNCDGQSGDLDVCQNTHCPNLDADSCV